MELSINGNRESIKTYLSNHKIYVDGGSKSLFISALILRRLLGDKEIDVEFKRRYNPTKLEHEYNICIIDKLSEMPAADKFDKYKENLVMSKFISDTIPHNAKVVFAEKDGKTIFFLFADMVRDSEFMSYTCLMTVLMPKLMSDVFKKEDILEHIRYIDFISGNIKNKNLESLILDGFSKEKELIDLINAEQKEKILKCVNFDSERKIENYKNEIESYNSRCGALLSQYRQCKEKCEEKMFRLSMVQAGMKNEEDIELFAEYMMNNKAIKISKILDSAITYGVYTEIKYYDIDYLETLLNNKTTNNYIYRNANYSKEIPYYESLFRKIFIDREYKIPTYAGYCINFIDNNINVGISLDEFRKIKDTIASPHSMHYHCSGSFEQNWIDAISEENYYMAVQNTIALTENINFADSTVASSLINSLILSDGEFLRDADGNHVSGLEVLEQIKNEMGGAEC